MRKRLRTSLWRFMSEGISIEIFVPFFSTVNGWKIPLVLSILLPQLAYTQDDALVLGRSNNNSQLNQIVEGCAPGFFTFFNTGSRFTETVYIIEFAGTARIGVDFDTITARRVIVPERVDSINLPINPRTDNFNEGSETILLIYSVNGNRDTSTLFLQDPPRIDAGKDTSLCSTESIQLAPTLLEEGTTYAWSPSVGLSSPNSPTPNFQLDVDEDTELSLLLTATTPNNCVASDSITLTIFDQPVSSFSGPTKLCFGTTGQYSYIGEASSNAEFQWDFGPDAVVESGSGPGPYILAWDSPGIKTVCLTVVDSLCPHETFCQNIEVGVGVDVEIQPVPDQCFDGHSLSFSLDDSLEVDEYTWNFGEGAIQATGQGPNPTGILYEVPGPKTVSLIVSKDGCTSGDQIQFELADPPGASFVLEGNTYCKDACIKPRYVDTIRGPEQQFNWNFGTEALPNSSGIANPVCTRFSDPGLKSISLTVSYKGCVETSSQSFTIEDLPIATVETGRDTSFCEGSGGVQLESAIVSGDQNVQYRWFSSLPSEDLAGINDPSSPSPLVNPFVEELPATVNYFLIVETANGCFSNVDSVQVRLKPLPKADAGEDRIFCEDSPGTFLLGKPAEENRAPGPFRYEWFPATGLNDNRLANPLATPENQTTYTLQISSLEGCSSIIDSADTLQTVTVFPQSLPIALTGENQTMCTGDTIQLSGSGQGTGGELTYNWTPSETGYMEDSSLASTRVSPLFSTTYSLVVSSNGCTSKAANLRIEVKPRPTVSAPSQLSICQGEAIQLQGLASGDTTTNQLFTYEWLPAFSLNNAEIKAPIARPDTSTTYEFRATSLDGCTSLPALSEVRVRPSPLPRILRDRDFICPGDTLLLQAEANFIGTPEGSPLTFEWGPQEEFFASQRFSDSLFVAPDTSVYFFLTTSISGDCPTTDSVWIELRSFAQVQAQVEEAIICEGSSTTLFAAGDSTGVQFTWMNFAGQILSQNQTWEVSPDSSNLYFLESNLAGCIDTQALNIEVIPLPKADYFSSSTSGCVDFTVAFLDNSEDALALIWDFGDGSPPSNESNPIHTYSMPGTYPVSLTAIGPVGCQSIAQTQEIVVSDTLFASFSSNPLPIDTLYIPNADVQFVDASLNPASWFWKFGDGKTSSEKSPLHSYWQPGEYDVVLTTTDANGCVSQALLGTYIVLNPRLWIPNVFTPNFDEIEDQFRIIYSGTDQVETQIFDRWGKRVYKGEGPENEWDGNYPNGEWAPEGVYYYDIKIGSEQHKGHLTLIR